jgi:hypothetical protein
MRPKCYCWRDDGQCWCGAHIEGAGAGPKIPPGYILTGEGWQPKRNQNGKIVYP